MVLANDPLLSRETLKDYTDKYDRSSKKRLMNSYAAQTTLDPAKDETEYTKQSNCPICGGKHDMDYCTIFNKQTGIPAKIISMCVVPVKIGHVGTKTEVSTLTMLDNCSQGAFMKESIKKIRGRKTEITIKKLSGKQNMESTLVTA